MRSNQRKGLSILGTALLAAVIFFFSTFSAESASRLPPYRSSGVIPGTSLLYEKLSISDRGEVKITIVNPTNNGVSFSANFGFYDNNDTYLTGFIVDGFAAANRKIVYSLTLDNYRAYRNATMMKVLGRAGRMGKDPDLGDDGQ